MKQLSSNRRAALIELARRGVGGEQANAREFLTQYGVDWKTGSQLHTERAQRRWVPFNINNFIEDLFGRPVDHKPLFIEIIEPHVLTVIRDFAGETATIERVSDSPCIYYFYGTYEEYRDIRCTLHLAFDRCLQELFEIYDEC